MKKYVFIFILLIVGIISYFSWFKTEKIEIIPTDKSNVIVVATPIKDSEVTSPLTVAGRARGNWFFEGSFPIVVEDSYGNIIAESHASAQGEWMSEDFVRFVGDIQFDNYIRGSEAFLILKKDNPSGLPKHDDSIRIPIILK
jgi:hypothetical protein